MPTRSRFLLLLTLFVLSIGSACREKGKYAVTVYFTSYDSGSWRTIDCPEKLGKKFMYSYEEFNADSNVVFAEYYTDKDPRSGSCGYWGGKPLQIWQTKWRGKEKLSAKVDYIQTLINVGRAYRHAQYSYQYRDGLLVRLLSKDQTVEAYDYNDHKQMIEKQEYYNKTAQRTTRYSYNNAGKKTTETIFCPSRLYTRDTFLYDKNNRLIEQKRFDSTGRLMGDRQIIRDATGRSVIGKGNEDADWAGWDGETRYYYDRAGYVTKEDYYSEGKLKLKFELITGPLRN